MTPLELAIVLHYYGRADDYRDGDFSPPAVRKAIDWLRDDVQIIEYNQQRRPSNSFCVTPRGRVFVEALLATPLPVQTWVMPPAAPSSA